MVINNDMIKQLLVGGLIDILFTNGRLTHIFIGVETTNQFDISMCFYVCL